ncbi:MAG TPA: RIP metalloprotease RseP [Candidatus Latescibacteria bacterium]|nr:RIP metalloprotease RseP [Candidatus Latescibacterota bacterium]HJP31422.1 RIP metalloprotease RseP [Candidatus Latescibacterota bacterium]
MLASAIDFLVTVGYFLIALGVLVFVHELGHFLVAKRAGIRVERFSLGYPPKMVGFEWGETEYCISWVPFGGYVKVAGMADVGEEAATGAPWEFPSKSVGVRMAVIAAGPLMNFLFAFAVFVVVYGAWGLDTWGSTVVAPQDDSVAQVAGLIRGDQVLEVDGEAIANDYELLKALEAHPELGAVLTVQRGDGKRQIELPAAVETGYGISILLPTKIGSVDPGTPAEGVGLQRGDVITAVEGTAVSSWSDMRELISARPAESIALAWQRDGIEMTSAIVPEERVSQDERIGVIGIRPFEAGSIDIGWWKATSLGAVSVYTSSYLILEFIGGIFENSRYKELGGPIRIARMADDTAQMGLKYFLRFLALLSVNLGVLNLLPIPVLDGGHLTFLTLEAILRRPPSVRQREVSQQIGLVIILFIMVAVTFNDLNQFVFHHIAELFQ